MIYNYAIITAMNVNEQIDYCRDMGNNGWRLVSVVYSEFYVLYFERVKQNQQP